MGKPDKLIRNIDQKEIDLIEKGKENRWERMLKRWMIVNIGNLIVVKYEKYLS